MPMTRCDKGLHLYDPNRDSACPHCRSENLSVGETKGVKRGRDGRVAETAGVERGQSVETKGQRKGSSAPETQGVWGKFVGFDPSEEAASTAVPEPVVGWLVCVDGPSRGRDYRVLPGMNTIGREADNRIQIVGDTGISRKGQARIAYDPKSNRFFLSLGEHGVNLNYLNGEPVLASTELKSFDKVTLGATTLLFVPLCGERFTWDVDA